MADTALTALTANITLPSGLNGKIAGFNMAEGKRWKDSEGFIDAGFQTGKLTGQGIAGRCVGYINNGSPGIGTPFENVSATFTADTGRAITLNIDITDIEWAARVGEMQMFAASFRSNGAYTGGTL